MKYNEITVSTTTEACEIVAYFMDEVSIGGVSIVDKNDLNIDSWDYVDDSLAASYTSGVLVKGYCLTEDTDSVLCFLREKFADLDHESSGSLEITIATVDGNSWLAKWKESFVPLNIGKKLCICPEWLEPSDAEGRRILKLDSGIAFGTGQHETTSMCLELLETVPVATKTVCDVGCGSGILGLAALLLGSKHATMVDIDSQATDAARYNAQLNSLAEKCTIVTGNLCDGVTGTFDIVLANLTAEILYILAADIGKIVKSGTVLILSGILTDRAAKVTDCFTQQGFQLKTRTDQGSWTALLMEY
jgi:ribosomal protein L11 methyltransferase